MTPHEALQFMRENKILHFRSGDLEITLHPEALVSEVEEKDVPKAPELDDKVIGRSGVTRKQQYELLGCVIESDFPQKGA